jgi:hypothetical protein
VLFWKSAEHAEIRSGKGQHRGPEYMIEFSLEMDGLLMLWQQAASLGQLFLEKNSGKSVCGVQQWQIGGSGKESARVKSTGQSASLQWMD